MGKTVINKEEFPEIVARYNSNGKAAAYDYVRSRYGVKHPYFVMNRIDKCGKYQYDPETDRFIETGISEADNVFLGLEELCGTAVINTTQQSSAAFIDQRPAALEKLVHELISDRLLTLSRYITLDSSTRTILIDKTSLSEDGYQIVSH